LEGYVQRRRIEQDQFMSLAWHIEAFHRSGKKFPSLDKVLGRKPKVASAKQSNKEILAAMRTWATINNDAVSKEDPQE